MPEFGRIVSVEFGEGGSSTGVKVTGLRVVFSIKKTRKRKTKKGKANEAEVSIYNLSENNRNRINEVENVLTLKAGYSESEGFKTLFVGNVEKVTSQKNGADWVTKFTVIDGSKALRDTKLGKSYKEGTGAKTILQDLVKQFGLSSKIVGLASISDQQYANGFSVGGQVSDAMDQVVSKLGLEWSIQDNEIKVFDSDSTDGSRAIVLNRETGLIGSPERISDVLKSKKKNAKKLPGWGLKSVLLPNAIPGGAVSVESFEIKAGSVFKIDSVTHQGDTHGSNWTTTLEVVEL